MTDLGSVLLTVLRNYMWFLGLAACRARVLLLYYHSGIKDILFFEMCLTNLRKLTLVTVHKSEVMPEFQSF